MADLGEIVVHLRADMKQLARGLAQAGSALRRFGSWTVGIMASAGRAIARFAKNAALRLGRFAKRTIKYATIALLGLGTAAVKMAMDAEESENLFKESMGGMASAARKWADEISNALGMNAFEVRKNVAVFNVMFDSMGFGAKKALEMSEGLTLLAYDMASFYNLKPEEAFLKIRSGIVGMSRPLQNLGILIKESNIQTWAVTNGLVKQGQVMSEQQKVMARYGSLMEQTTKSQGDMERTLDSTTNIIRALWSQIQLLGIMIGNELKPAVDEVGKAMRDWLIDHRDDVRDYVRVAIENLKQLVDYMRNDWVEGLKLVLKGALIAFMAFGESIYIVVKAAFMRIIRDSGGWMKELVGKIPGGKTLGKVGSLYMESKAAEGRFYGAGGEFEGPPDPRGTMSWQLKETAAQAAKDIKKLYQDQGVFVEKDQGEQIPDEWIQDWLENGPARMEEVADGLKGVAGASEMVADTTFDIAAAYRSMYGQMGRMSKKGYEAEITRLNSLKEEYEQHGMDKLAVDEWYREQQEKAEIAMLKSGDSIVGGFVAAGAELRRTMKTWGEVGFDVAMSISGSMSTAFDSIIEGTKSASEAFQQFGLDITRAITRAVTDMIAQFIVMKAMTGIGFMGFGTGGKMVGDPITTGTPGTAYAHRGGRIGQLQMEPMPAGLFANAPRFHGGLAADEFPTILQRGEEVNKAGDDGGPKVVVNIDNQTNAQMEAETSDISYDGESLIVGVVVKNYRDGGAIRDMVRSPN